MKKSIEWPVYSGQVELDARGPPSQLQEALKESAKVDAEYNFPTWVPKTRVNMTKRRIPGVELRVHHVLPRVAHKSFIMIVINWGCARNRHKWNCV
jgi:hypothetical protein